MISFIFIVIMMFVVLLIFIIFWLSFNEKLMMFNMKNLFETGVEVNKFSRISFSIQFFFIMVVFILFDLEIIFLVNMFFSLKNVMFMVLFLSLLLFIFLTLLYEWKFNKILWLK